MPFTGTGLGTTYTIDHSGVGLASATLNPSAAVPAGKTLMLMVGVETQSSIGWAIPTGVTDSKGNVWTRVTATPSGSSIAVAGVLYVTQNSAAMATTDTITVTFANPSGRSSTFVSKAFLTLVSITGINGSSAYAATIVAGTSTGGTSHSSVTTSASVQAGDFVFAGAPIENQNNTVPALPTPAGWTTLSRYGTQYGTLSDFQTGSGGAVTYSQPYLAPPSYESLVIVAFQPASGGQSMMS